MIIAIDIGNTNTGIAVIDVGEGLRPSLTRIKEARIVQTETVKTGIKGCYEKRLVKAFRALSSELRAQSSEPTKVIICSVVPKATAIVARCVKRVFKIAPKIVGKDIIVPIKNKYDEPEQVGQDRLVCAYAAAQLYGAPAVVVDLGTAITFDVVKKEKGAWHHEYLGGMIVPGIRLSAEALYEKTALLPKIDIHKPKRLIGKTTEESMLSGIFYGYGEMIKGLIDLLSKQLKEKPHVIVTGGYSDLMKHYVADNQCVLDKDLIFKGIALLV